ncbi:MAG: PqqD family protein [Flavobacteriales bacterium]
MQGNLRFSIFDRNIVSDVFGEEVVLVNLETGVYYSLRASATQVWIRIQNNYSLDEIIADLHLIYAASQEELTQQTYTFIQQLLDRQLIKQSTSEEKNIVEMDAPQQKLNFSTPVLEVFSDMQEILLLDPVHDVDKSGWPVTKDGSSK